MDFASIARSIKRKAPEYCRDSAADVVGNASPSSLLDKTKGRVAEVALDSAATVVALISSVRNRARCQPQRRPAATTEGETSDWDIFDAGILEVQARLAHNVVPSQVFQTQLLLALRHEACREGEEAAPGGGERDWSSTAAVPLALYWRLHELRLLPFSFLLEASEALPSTLALGRRCGGECHRRSSGDAGGSHIDTVVHGIRTLAIQSSREISVASSSHRDAASLVSDIAKHLFDLAYRKLPIESETLDIGSGTTKAPSSKAARMVLDQLCCGPEVFGTPRGVEDTEARLRGCLSVLAAIAPVATSVTSLQPCSATGSRDNGTPSDEYSVAFLNRQLRLLMENSSGERVHVQGDGGGVFETDKDLSDVCIMRLFADILRHFPSSQCVEVLRSTCLEAVARAADTAGIDLHKPLLRWETFGPVVRAAAMAHPQEIPAAVALIGTELAGAAVNINLSGDAYSNLGTGCNHQQGVLVLSAALRLVAQADFGLQCARRRSGVVGVYAPWVRDCFGPHKEKCPRQEINQAEVMPSRPEHEQEEWVPEPHVNGLRLSNSEALREVMEKQRATQILMEALSLSVPYDPAFVLEVHKDVLKARLRAKFSVQVRDFVDLVATRLSDLKSQEGARKYKGPEKYHDLAPGVDGSMSAETNQLDGGCSDTAVQEVGFFLRQFKQTGAVPLALKTAILWHPKSWARLRKILLAPPGKRISMPDESGKMQPAGGHIVKETIGRGENGLLVEVSLKYRRLLVQKLAKESLLSAKDHEAFRKSYVEYLQGQRDRNTDESEGPNRDEGGSAVSHQILLLESRMVRRQGGDISADGLSTIEERLALLLQEYLPRALSVALCMEDATSNSHSGLDWFARAVRIFHELLQEWEHRHRTGGIPPGVRTTSPRQLAEAILNSVHCCVASFGASLLSPHQPCHGFVGNVERGSVKVKAVGDRNAGVDSGDPDITRSAMDEVPGFLDLPVAQAFRRVGEVVTIAAGVEPLGEVICRRCLSLLTDLSSLDPKQVLSVCHVLAALPPTFHLKVGGFLSNLVTKIILPASTENAVEMVDLLSTAQVGAWYLKSSLLMHKHVWEGAADGVASGNPEHNHRRRRSADRPHMSHPPSFNGGCSKTPSRLGNETVGVAPVILLEFCWWMERRLSILQQMARSEGRIRHLATEIVGLQQHLQGVLEQPLVKRIMNQIFRTQGLTMPPLERLISFELAVSTDFGGALARMAFLESVTLGSLVEDQPYNTKGLHSGALGREEEELEQLHKEIRATSVEEIWKECAACLFADPNLRHAALRRVCMGSTPNETDHNDCVEIEQAVQAWKSSFHSSWRNRDDTLMSDSEGVEELLDSMLKVMGKLCNLEATAGSMYEKGDPPRDLCKLDHGLHSVNRQSRRKASLLLTEALSLLTRTHADAGPALVLIAEIALPAIGATEGREKAVESLRLMWKEWFCKARPLDYGVIVTLMRVALMWCGGRRDAENTGRGREESPVVFLLEELPWLAAEIVRVWPRLRLNLQPILGSGSLTGPYARGGWAFYVNNLHRVGEDIVRGLVGREWASLAPEISTKKTRGSTPKAGRVPLGPVDITMQDQRGRQGGYARGKDQDCARKAHVVARLEVGTAELGHDHFRDTSAALPRTSAQVVVDVIRAAATFLVRLRTKPSREEPVQLADAKRRRTSKTSTVRGRGAFSEELPVCEEGKSRSLSQRDLLAIPPPPASSWVERVLKPVYGYALQTTTTSPLRELLETLVTELGFGIFSPGQYGETGGLHDLCESFGASLLVAVLDHAPSLVARMAEPPCLVASSSSCGPTEKVGRSLAVLKSLKTMFDENPHGYKPGTLVVLLSHYSAALLTVSEGAVPNRQHWSDITAFVHACVRKTSPQDVRQLPAALRQAARDVDPLLKQYLR